MRRAVFLESAGARELHVLVGLRVPEGDARRSLEVLADRDLDGALSGPELRRVEQVLATRALDGLVLRAGTSTLALSGVEVKLKREPRGPVEVMLHAVASLPPAPVRLVVSTGPGGDPVDLVVVPGSRPIRAATSGDRSGGGLKVTLLRNDRVEVDLGAPPPSPP